MTEDSYLGYWISQTSNDSLRGPWCRTVAERSDGEVAFTLVEHLPFEARRHRGWPTDTKEATAILQRQGIGIARALIALDEIPAAQFSEVTLPAEGPPYTTPDEQHLAQLLLRSLANLETIYRRLDESRIDIRGIGELVWAREELSERVLDRLIDRQEVEFKTTEWEDNFGSLKITEKGRTALDNDDAQRLSGNVRGFTFSPPPSIKSEAVMAAESAPGGKPEIFLVHGKDEAAKQTVARWLERGGAEVTILHERANVGRTLIEKFEGESATAAYAVVLAIGDDEGRLLGDPALRPRARQNVVLELGFFFGTLGRGRVATLMQEGIELPTDYAGIAYIPFDSHGGWKLQLAKEFVEVGIPFDLLKANG